MRGPIRLSMGLPFTEAAMKVRSLVPMLPSEYYGSIPDEARHAAFTVSTLASLEQITAVMDSLYSAMRSGMSMKEWREQALKTDWSLSPARLDLIYRTHVQNAYMMGHWRQFEENRMRRGYLMYSAIDDARVRPSHLAMSGYVARIDDAIWNQWSPPCGFNCRCTLISLTEAQAKARGLGTQQQPNVFPDNGFGHHPRRAKQALSEYLNHALKTQTSTVAEAVVKREVNDAPPNLVKEVRKAYGTHKYDEILMVVGDKHRALGIAEESAVSLMGYTGKFYRQINAALRGDDALLKKWGPVASAAERALSLMDKFKGTVYRGTSADSFKTFDDTTAFFAAHRAGNVVEYKAFTSTASKAGFGGVQFVIKSETGVALNNLSYYAHEQEVLFRPGTKFRVTKVEFYDNTQTVSKVFMEEVPFDTPVKPGHSFAAMSDNKPAGHTHPEVQDRYNDEIAGFDNRQFDAFVAKHGMTPREWIAKHDPIYAELLQRQKEGK
jgi:SPP1 gp7 family putative phage head morphogenesis protein